MPTDVAEAKASSLAAPKALTLQPATPAPAASQGPQLTGPLIVIGLLAVAAVVFSKRKKKQTGWIQVLETASLGPRRSLVVARVGDETVLFGSGESGITLLKAGLTRTEPVVSVEPAGAEPSFESLLDESAEDQALRMKLMAGQPARVGSGQRPRDESPFGQVAF